MLGAEKFAAARELIHGLKGVTIRINHILHLINPPLHSASLKLHSDIVEAYDWAKDLFPNDPLLFHGQSIAFNRQTPSHTDSRGPMGEWTPLVGLGFSSGVKLRLAGVKEIIPFDSGTIIFIRGGEMAHAIEAWSGGQRISIAIFTHKTIWEQFKVQYPWSCRFPEFLYAVPSH